MPSKVERPFLCACPNCGRQRRVDPQAFPIAAGRVKCGQCNSIFLAHQHALKQALHETHERPQTRRAKPAHAIPTLQATPTPVATPQRRPVFAYLLCVLLSGTIIVQLGYFNRASWSQYSVLAPAYSAAQRWLGNDVWQLEQLEQLALKIVDHREYQDSLLVSFELHNRGAITLQAPDVELIFSDLQGNVTARRRFAAHHYLSATPKAIKLAAGASVNARLAILKPAERALNYRLDLKVPLR